jgi:hypothetical protein
VTGLTPAPLVIRSPAFIHGWLLRRQSRGLATPHKASARRGATWGGVAAAGLLIVYAAMAFSASLTKGVSFDEGQQLAVGYNIWLNNDYRIEGANGDFIKRWATLPYLVSRPKFVGRDDPYWRRAEPYEVGYKFFFEVGNRPEELLRQGRAMMVLLGVATGWLVFAWSRKLFGTAGGLISLGLFVFSPHMLAFGAIVSTEMSIVLLLFAATGCIWRLLHVVTWGRVAVSLAVVGMLVLAKLSALVILPITAVLIGVKFVAGGPLAVGWRGRWWRLASRASQAGVVAALVGLHAVSGWTAIWAHYGFRYAASPVPTDTSLGLRVAAQRVTVAPAVAAGTEWARRAHFFPEGFQRGVEELLASDNHLGAFMAGDWKLGGWRGFFPYAIWVKTRPALLLLLVVAAVGWWWARRNRDEASGTAGGPSLYAVAPWLVLPAVYLSVAMAEDINLGHRHVLPIYPALYVLAGAAALIASAAWGRAVVAALLVWMVRDSVAVRPNYLAFFGAQAGGPAKGYTRLVDSSLDWGMNLPELKAWLDEHNPGGKAPVFLGYFGTDNPEHYGIKAESLPGFFDWRKKAGLVTLRPGYYAISASLLQGVYTASFGPWTKESERTYRTVLQNFAALNRTKPGSPERRAFVQTFPKNFWEDEAYVLRHLRFARLCAWLRHQGEPPYHIGHAIFVWKLDRRALQAALLGPPVELVDRPMVLRRQ